MTNFKELLKKHEIVLVDFYAEWCAPCRMMTPILNELKQAVGDRIEIVKINIDLPNNHELTSSYNIRAVPTMMLFRDGKAVWQHSGIVSLADLRELIRKHSTVAEKCL